MKSVASYWLPPLAWMALIWWVSSDIGSPDHSAVPFAWIFRMLVPWATPHQIEFAHVIARKIGHMVEYAILAGLWFRTFHADRRLPFTPSAWIALAVAVSWAIIDEVHQSFVPTRQASAVDVMLDSTGAAIILLTLYVRTTLTRVTPRVSPRGAI